ncbi:MAG: permease-like cell division protein FtsX [Burkholderiales bacterium]|nr:permease-like cell division protein FtsX [Burkholderiales bacterium]
MRAWLRQHRRAAAAALARMVAHKAATALNLAAIGIALALPAGAYALLESLRAAAAGVSLEPQLAVYLKPEASRAEAEALGARLAKAPSVREVRFVPREQALRELQAVEGLAELAAALETNPLPDAFVVRLRPASGSAEARAAAVEALAGQLRAFPAVAHVQADPLWARRLAALVALGRLAIGLLAALLAFGLIAITFNTIRLQILTQRAEIEVAKLIGATDAFIRRPFLYLGALQGLGGGAVALALVWGVLAALDTAVAELAATYGSQFRLRFLEPADAAAILAFSCFLGWVGALMSVSRHLREMEPT